MVPKGMTRKLDEVGDDGKQGVQSKVNAFMRTREEIKRLAEELKDVQEELRGCSATDQQRPQEQTGAALQGILHEASHRFTYKKRLCKGTALHIAVQHPEWCDLVKELLEKRADPHQKLNYVAGGKESTVDPIHLAVQSGQPEILEALLNKRADVNASALREGKPHFTPLHEAAFFMDSNMVKTLIKKRAQVDDQNQQGFSPLHVAVKMGAADVAELLVKSLADLSLQDNAKRTPLEVAVASGTFPPQQLHVLGTWTLRDIIHVSKYQRGAAAAFIRNVWHTKQLGLTQRNEGRNSKTAELRVKHWTILMQQAPEAATALLEVLTAEPQEENPFYHPLPAQAAVKNVRLCYNDQSQWSYSEVAPDNEKWPVWHDELVPGVVQDGVGGGASQPERSDEGLEEAQGPFDVPLVRPVQIRLLKLKKFVSAEVLRELAVTEHWEIFEQPAVVALLEYVWLHIVRDYYGVQMLYRCMELLVMILWTLFPPTEGGRTFWDSHVRCSASWSLLFVTGTRWGVQQLCECWEHFYSERNRNARRSAFSKWVSLLVSYWTSLMTLSEWLGIILFLVFLGKTAFRASDTVGYDLAEDVVLFSWVILTRWMSFIWSFRGYSFGSIGTKSLLLDCSYELRQDLLSVILGAVLFFLAFWHLFVNLDAGTTFGTGAGRISAIMVATFRLLLQQDGNGIDGILQLGYGGTPGPGGQPGNSTTIPFMFLGQCVFSITLMNAFIAVYTGAFRAAGKRRHVHLKERAEICCRAMMQPKWPPALPSWTSGSSSAAAQEEAGPGPTAIAVKSAWGSSSEVIPAGGHHEAPKAAAKAEDRFLKRRASTVVEVGQSGWKGQPNGILKTGALLVLLAALLTWGAILAAAPTVHPVLAGLILLLGTLLFDWVLLTRPWKDEDCYLWWCAPANWGQDDDLPDSEQVLKVLLQQFELLEKRLHSIETVGRSTNEKLTEDLKNLEKAMRAQDPTFQSSRKVEEPATGDSFVDNRY